MGVPRPLQLTLKAREVCVAANALTELVGASVSVAAAGVAGAAGGSKLPTTGVANSSFTIYAKSEYWLNSPAQVLTKVGVLFLMVSLAFVWTRYGAGEGWSWIRQFGVTSLLVYWVHIELLYAHASWFFKNNLTVPQTLFAAAIVILLMLALSTMKTHREKWQTALSNIGWNFAPRPDSSAGD